ncbi:MAG: hypothetical protein NTW71_00815 [Deltaproteobacteria bacterium]|nr:hypothetical protein [Deltaproteobacteria bacterium]
MDKAHPMNLSDIRFPRQLEADETAETIRKALMARTVRLWPGGDLDVARIAMNDPLKKALRKARLMGRIRCGFEAVFARLAIERKGIMNVRERRGVPYGDRVSRLLLFSNDGAERFYRHIESLLQAQDPRLLGCLLDIDGCALGNLLTGKDRQIKLVMAEHKDAVSEILRTIRPA